MPSELETDMLAQLAHSLLLRITGGAQIFLGHPDRAQRQRDEPLDKTIGAEGELE